LFNTITTAYFSQDTPVQRRQGVLSRALIAHREYVVQILIERNQQIEQTPEAPETEEADQEEDSDLSSTQQVEEERFQQEIEDEQREDTIRSLQQQIEEREGQGKRIRIMARYDPNTQERATPKSMETEEEAAIRREKRVQQLIEEDDKRKEEEKKIQERRKQKPSKRFNSITDGLLSFSL